MFFLIFIAQLKYIKKDVDLVLPYLEVLEIPVYQNKKSPRYTRGRFLLILLVNKLKFSRFQDTKNKQKRFFKSIKFQFAKVKQFLLTTKKPQN